ncbi:MAG: hypothetical protein IPH58_15210 [Sphingobacteriales bacterium]|nr:hypothetical protein [Sphingobacteriales bacterium]
MKNHFFNAFFSRPLSPCATIPNPHYPLWSLETTVISERSGESLSFWNQKISHSTALRSK